MTTLMPARGVLSVRPIDSAESLPGSRILLTSATRERLTANQLEVLAVGAFDVCDPESGKRARKCHRPHAIIDGSRVHPHPIVAGDWIIVAPRTTLVGPDPERAEWFVHQDSVLGIFDSEP